MANLQLQAVQEVGTVLIVNQGGGRMKEYNIIEAVKYLKEHHEAKFYRYDINRSDIKYYLEYECGVITTSKEYINTSDITEPWILEEQPKLVIIDIDKTIREIKNELDNHYEPENFQKGIQYALRVFNRRIKDNIKNNEKDN